MPLSLLSPTKGAAMKTVFSFLLIASLAACGADGAPERPEAATTAPGLTFGGTAEIGIAKNGG
jgi:predicted small lipoprotein YifL